MAGTPKRTGSEVAPTAAEVGNHHWPKIANIYGAHGDRFPKHHCHLRGDGSKIPETTLKLIHKSPVNMATHDVTAVYHEPKEEDYCRNSILPPSGRATS